MATLRIAYSKEKYMKYLGHLELMKLFERIFRVNKMPLKFSEGFNPIPKLTFAAPLSVGYSTKYDVMEVTLDREVPISDVLKLSFPDGIDLKDAIYVDCKASLMSKVEYADYLVKIEFQNDVSQLPFKDWVESFMQLESVTYDKKTKKGKIKTINVLDQIYKLTSVYCMDNEWIFKGTFASGSNGSLNPEKFVEVFLKHYKIEKTIESIEVERLGLYFSENDALVNLFDLKDTE